MTRGSEASKFLKKSLGRGHAIKAARKPRDDQRRAPISLMDRLDPKKQDDAPFFRTEGRDRLPRLRKEYRAAHARRGIEKDVG
jgi:hypothetical protein